MGQMLSLLGGVVALWHERSFRRLRDSIILTIITATVFILPGAFLGGMSPTLKVVWLEIGIMIALGVALYLAACRFVIGAEIATLVEAHRNQPGQGGPITTPVEGAVGYVQAVAAFAASIAASGVIAIYIPAHRNPPAAFLFLIGVIMLIFHAVWMSGTLKWPKIVWWLAVFTIFFSLLLILVPKVPRYTEAVWTRFESVLECKFGDGKCPPPVKTDVKEAKPSTQIANSDRIIHNAVLVRQADGWLDVQGIFPACTNYSLNRRGDKRVSVRFSDGSVATIGDPQGQWGIRRPKEFRVEDATEETVDVWLTDIGRDCGGRYKS